MTPLARQQFVDEVYIAGALNAKRKQPVKLIHRVPFSSGLSSGPGVSTDVEKITRTAMEKLGNKFSGPIWVEMKFNWSHGHSTPKLVKVHGGTLGDTYFKPAPSNYKIVWQVRNEDFFALRWGVPDFIRQHIALNGSAGLRRRLLRRLGNLHSRARLLHGRASKPVDWKWAFQRQWLFYKLWGRLLYDPKTPDALFQAEFTRRYGKRGENLLQAYALASNTQMRLASLYDSRWDFTLYGEGMLALQGEHTNYIGVDALINQPTLDPAYVSVADFVKTTQAGGIFGADRITPLQLADLLERDCLRGDAPGATDRHRRQRLADVRSGRCEGLGAPRRCTWRRSCAARSRWRPIASTGDEEIKQQAISHLQQALAYWDQLVIVTRPLYRDMKLTHYNGNSFDANPDNLFHWERDPRRSRATWKSRGQPKGRIDRVSIRNVLCTKRGSPRNLRFDQSNGANENHHQYRRAGARARHRVLYRGARAHALAHARRRRRRTHRRLGHALSTAEGSGHGRRQGAAHRRATMAATGRRCISTWWCRTSMRPPRAPWRPARNRKPDTWTGADHAASASATLSATASASSSSNATEPTTTSSVAPNPAGRGSVP